MTRKKLKHFAEMKEWPHVIEPASGEACDRRGNWGDPLIMELGCGQGDYSVELGKRLTEATVVGVDIKGSRMWHGARRALEEGLENVFFLRTRIEHLGEFFEGGEVDEIWITFPDPQPREGKAKKRLTSPRFLKIYEGLLKAEACVHLKTDSRLMFESTLESAAEAGWRVVEQSEDVYGEDAGGLEVAGSGVAKNPLLTKIQTQYERRYLAEGKKIYYVRLVPSLGLS